MKPTLRVPVRRFSKNQAAVAEDAVAVEEPLEIRLGFLAEGQRASRALSVTMRTPGSDAELAAGFLFTEGIIQNPEEIVAIGQPAPNVVRVELASTTAVDLALMERRTYIASSCGICGKGSLEAVAAHVVDPLQSDGPHARPATIHGLPATLRAAQALFEETGGLHASALFNLNGELLGLREDVGRHNALDKLIGWQFLSGKTPLHNCMLLVSGRTSFELTQKALRAGLPVLAGVGAPSSLAIELAREHDLTLLGFVREGRFTAYSGEWRLMSEGDGPDASHPLNA